MILRTLTLAAAAQGLALTRSRPRTRLQAEKPAWADAVKDEAVAEDVVADSPSLFDFFGGASVNSEAAKALREEMRKMTATVDAAVGGGGASAAGVGAAGTGGGVGGGMSDVDVSDCELGIFMHDGCVRLCVLRMCCVDLLITDSLLNEARDSVKCLCALERYTESL